MDDIVDIDFIIGLVFFNIRYRYSHLVANLISTTKLVLDMYATSVHETISGLKEDCGTPLQGWLKVWEAVFDPNHYFDQTAESMFSKWSSEKNNLDELNCHWEHHVNYLKRYRHF